MNLPGESVALIPWQAYLFLAVLLSVYLLLAYTRRLPSIHSFKDFADTINSAGGHIIVLSGFTYLSMRIAMHFIYWVLSLPGDVITKQQAQIAVGIAFVTGSLFGTFSGALLKTMSGGKANGVTPPPVPDKLTASVVPPPDEK